MGDLYILSNFFIQSFICISMDRERLFYTLGYDQILLYGVAKIWSLTFTISIITYQNSQWTSILLNSMY